MKKVFVGMSGGVDSSVTAALLKEQGYEVIGIYMKNWSQNIGSFMCPWQQDFQDAKRVAVKLDIGFKMYDFEKDYRRKVVDYMINEYKAGRTPNPDIMCNSEIKFKLFFETALEDGADLISTGHYARIRAKSKGRRAELWTSKDVNKDQTYFLYRVGEDALQKTLFPIGELESKAEVRALAKKYGLPTAEKKDSQGICFVGSVGIKDFLGNFVKTKPGAIIDQSGKVIGQHDGAIFYTIGQRHGLSVGGGLPYYVTGKNMATNQVFVTNNLDDQKLWQTQLTLTDLHWINQPPKVGKSYQVRTRYRAPLSKVKSFSLNGKNLKLTLADAQRAITPGQSAVIYNDQQVLGGGIVC